MDQASRRSAATTTPLWRDSRAKRLLAAFTYPIFYLLNRPAFQGLNNVIYDFALRCNGIAINFKGSRGLTVGEERFLQCYLPRSSGALFDVGANHGAYARVLHAFAPQAPIYAFEPHPRTFAHLQATCMLPNVTLVNQAMGGRDGTMTLFDMAADDGSTQASLSRDAVAMFSKDVVEHAITCTTFDGFVEQHGIGQVALLKIDTEGHDLDVLKGASRAIAAKRIRAIQFEFIPANIATHVSMRDFFDALPGYRLHRLCMNGGLLPLPKQPYSACRTDAAFGALC